MQIKDLRDEKFRLRMAVGIAIVSCIRRIFRGDPTVALAHLPCRWMLNLTGRKQKKAQKFGREFKRRVSKKEVPFIEFVKRASNRGSRYRFTGTASDKIRLIIQMLFGI